MYSFPDAQSIPEISLSALKKHNHITGWHTPRNEEQIKSFLNKNTITLRPHPPVQLATPIDWHADPLKQRNWCTQLHMLRWLELLFYPIDDGDMEAQKHCEEIITSWTEAAFGPNPPHWAWKDMIDATRTMWLLKAFERVSPDYRPFLASVLYAHGTHFENPDNLGNSSHAAWQYKALLALGEVFNKQTWIDLALERIQKAFSNDFTDTGINLENAPGCHIRNYYLWKEIISRLPENSSVKKNMNETLSLIASRICTEVRPDGYLEEIGDTAPKHHIRQLAGNPEADYILSQGKNGTLPEETTTILETGFIYARSGWGENARDFRDEFFYSLRFGEQGVRGHNDLGSVTMYSHGTPVLIDAGRYSYALDEWRRYFNKRDAHNTLYIPGLTEEEATYALTQSHSDSFIDDFTVIGEPYKGVKHERRLIYVKGADSLLTMDIMRSAQPQDCSIAWHFAPSAKVNTDNKKHFDITIGKEQFKLIQLDSPCDEVSLITKGQTAPYIQGYYSPAYNQKAPCPTLIQTRKNTRSAHVMNVIAHAANNIFDVRPITDANTAFSLQTKTGYFIIDTSQTPASVTFSRELPKEIAITTGRIEDIYPTIIQTLSTSKPSHLHTASKLQHRLSLLTGVEGSIEDILTAAFTSPLLAQTRDYGLRAALIDLIAVYDQKSAGIVMKTSPLFRKPLFNSSFVEKGEECELLCESENRPFKALRIVDEHALYWQGMKGNSTLVVRFQAALNRSRIQIPCCGGITAHIKRPESWLIFADPALDRDASAGLTWYLGKTSTGTIYDEINRVVDDYVREWGIDHVIFLGPSGGGYVALQTGLRRGNCDVLCLNPQTILKSYHPNVYETAIDATCLDENSDIDLLDVTLLLKHLKEQTVSIHYVTNPHDAHHTNHFLPFKKIAEDNDIVLDIIELDLGKGHVPVSPEMFQEILDSIV